MRVSIDPSEVEELAWLVKDNLHAKHLVLSAEELFVEFLEPSYEGGASLELEPMLSYPRMLLHRLADCFGLIHESVGEGNDRHIVIERCEDSSIPLMLVSNVLESCYGELHHAPSNRQLLLRNCDRTDDQENQRSTQSPVLSLEEREAAYQAARERIFSDPSISLEDSLEQRESQRIRPVPIVARRMIAHALGNPIALTTVASANEMSSSLENLPPEIPKESPRHSSAKAARRMLTQALGFPVSSPSSRGPDRQTVKIRGSVLANEASCSNSNADSDVTLPVRASPVITLNATENEEDWRSGGARGKSSESTSVSGSDPRTTEGTPTRSSRKDQPGAAARRMFAQALGLPHTVSITQSVDEDMSKGGSQYHSTGGKKTSSTNINALVYLSHESDSLLNQCIHPVESASEPLIGRSSRGNTTIVDHSKSEVAVQEDQRKGGGRAHKFGNHRGLKEQFFQEDQETGELFFTRSQP